MIRDQLITLNGIRAAVRRTLTERGVLEVVTPVSVLSPGGETHLEAVPIQLHPLGRQAQQLHLRTSPEVWHKKLLAQGSGPIFELAPCFRDHEAGPWHDLEFEMVEWYRPGEGFDALIEDLRALIDATYEHTGRCAPAFTRYTVEELFLEHVGCPLDPSTSTELFKALLQSHGLKCADDDTWDDAFFRAWISRVEPALAGLGAVVVERYPASQAAMARLCDDDERFCARFELYIDGIELANAFDELTDGSEQERRFRQWQDERIALGRAPFPIDSSFFEAVSALPPTVGIALGLDRLMAAALGSKSLADVRLFKLDDLLEKR